MSDWAENPETGEKLRFKDGFWQPVERAENPETGEKLIHWKGSWQPVEQPTPAMPMMASHAPSLIREPVQTTSAIQGGTTGYAPTAQQFGKLSDLIPGAAKGFASGSSRTLAGLGGALRAVGAEDTGRGFQEYFDNPTTREFYAPKTDLERVGGFGGQVVGGVSRVAALPLRVAEFAGAAGDRFAKSKDAGMGHAASMGLGAGQGIADYLLYKFGMKIGDEATAAIKNLSEPTRKEVAKIILGATTKDAAASALHRVLSNAADIGTGVDPNRGLFEDVGSSVGMSVGGSLVGSRARLKAIAKNKADIAEIENFNAEQAAKAKSDAAEIENFNAEQAKAQTPVEGVTTRPALGNTRSTNLTRDLGILRSQYRLAETGFERIKLKSQIAKMEAELKGMGLDPTARNLDETQPLIQNKGVLPAGPEMQPGRAVQPPKGPFVPEPKVPVFGQEEYRFPGAEPELNPGKLPDSGVPDASMMKPEYRGPAIDPPTGQPDSPTPFGPEFPSTERGKAKLLNEKTRAEALKAQSAREAAAATKEVERLQRRYDAQPSNENRLRELQEAQAKRDYWRKKQQGAVTIGPKEPGVDYVEHGGRRYKFVTENGKRTLVGADGDATGPDGRTAYGKTADTEVQGRNLNRTSGLFQKADRIAQQFPEVAGPMAASRANWKADSESFVNRHAEARMGADRFPQEKLLPINERIRENQIAGRKLSETDAADLGLDPSQFGTLKRIEADYESQGMELVDALRARAKVSGDPDDMKIADEVAKVYASNPGYMPRIRSGDTAQAFTKDGKLELIVSGKGESGVKKSLKEWGGAGGLEPMPLEAFGDALKKGRGAKGNVDLEALNEAARRLGVSDPSKLANIYEVIAQGNTAKGYAQHQMRAEKIRGFDLDLAASHDTYTRRMARAIANAKNIPEFESRAAAALGKPHRPGAVAPNQDIVESQREAFDFMRNPEIGALPRGAMKAGSILAFAHDTAQAAVQPVQALTTELPAIISYFGVGKTGAWLKAQALGSKVSTMGGEFLPSKLRQNATARKVFGDSPFDTLTEKNLASLRPNGVEPAEWAAEVKDFLKKQYESGAMFDARAGDFANTSKVTGITPIKKGLKAIGDSAYYALERGEFRNRVSADIAFYSMLRSKGMPVSTSAIKDGEIDIDKIWGKGTGPVRQFSAEEAARVAPRLTGLVHNISGTSNTSGLQRAGSGLGAAASQFMYYPIELVQQNKAVAKETYRHRMANPAQGESKAMTRSAAIGAAAVPVIMASLAQASGSGAEGVPMANDAWELVRAAYNMAYLPLYGKPDELGMRSMQVALEEELRKTKIPKPVQDLLRKGAPYAFAGTDASGRLGASKILNINADSPKDLAKSIIARLMGPGVGQVMQKTEKALGSLSRGDTNQAAIDVLPRGDANIVKAIDGKVRGPHGVTDLTPAGRVFTGFGFRDRETSDDSSLLRLGREKSTMTSTRGTVFARKLAFAIKANSDDLLGKALRDIKTYNAAAAKEGRTLEIIKPTSIMAKVEEEMISQGGKRNEKKLKQLKAYLEQFGNQGD